MTCEERQKTEWVDASIESSLDIIDSMYVVERLSGYRGEGGSYAIAVNDRSTHCRGKYRKEAGD